MGGGARHVAGSPTPPLRYASSPCAGGRQLQNLIWNGHVGTRHGSTHPAVWELDHRHVLGPGTLHIHGVGEADVLEQEEQRLQCVVLLRRAHLSRPGGRGLMGVVFHLMPT